MSPWTVCTRLSRASRSPSTARRATSSSALYLFECHRRRVEDEAVDAGPTGRLRDPRLSQADAPVRELKPPVHGAGPRIRRRAQVDIHGACGRFEPRTPVVGRLEGVRPSREVTRVAQELEHFGTRGSDLNALDIKHAHDRLLGLKGLVLPLDDVEVRIVTDLARLHGDALSRGSVTFSMIGSARR